MESISISILTSSGSENQSSSPKKDPSDAEAPSNDETSSSLSSESSRGLRAGIESSKSKSVSTAHASPFGDFRPSKSLSVSIAHTPSPSESDSAAALALPVFFGEVSFFGSGQLCLKCPNFPQFQHSPTLELGFPPLQPPL